MRNTRPARVLGYLRVSGREQGERGTSLDGQRERVIAWCAERGFPKPELFVEVESGGEEKREKRVEYARLQAEARAGDLIVVCKVDRWTRDLGRGVTEARALVKRGVGWYSIDEGIDGATTQGDSILGLMSWVADQERKRIRERTIGARDRLRDQGLWVEGPAPFGYARGDRDARRHLHLEVVGAEAALIREAFERCAKGASVVDVSEWLNAERGTDRDRRQTWTMLRNRLYCGDLRSSSKAWIKGRHEAIVSRELFERAQAALVGRRKTGRQPTAEARTASWLLRGLGSCPECGVRMSASYSRAIGYYACGNRMRNGTCDADYGRVDRIDAIAADLALARLVELRLEIARPGNESGEPPKAPSFAAQRERLAARIARAERGFVDGHLSAEALRRERERLDEELGRVEVAAGAAARAERAGNPIVRRRILADLRRVERAWAKATVELRRTALAVLAKTIRIRANDVEIAWRTPDELCMTGADGNLFAGPDDVPPRGGP